MGPYPTREAAAARARDRPRRSAGVGRGRRGWRDRASAAESARSAASRLPRHAGASTASTTRWSAPGGGSSTVPRSTRPARRVDQHVVDGRPEHRGAARRARCRPRRCPRPPPRPRTPSSDVEGRVVERRVEVAGHDRAGARAAGRTAAPRRRRPPAEVRVHRRAGVHHDDRWVRPRSRRTSPPARCSDHPVRPRRRCDTRAAVLGFGARRTAPRTDLVVQPPLGEQPGGALRGRRRRSPAGPPRRRRARRPGPPGRPPRRRALGVQPEHDHSRPAAGWRLGAGTPAGPARPGPPSMRGGGQERDQPRASPARARPAARAAAPAAARRRAAERTTAQAPGSDQRRPAPRRATALATDAAAREQRRPR